MSASITSKICRVCCNQKLNDLVSLLDVENKTIVKKLRACADVTIEQDDLLPKYICKTCQNCLNAAYNFKIKCEYMDQKFRDTFANGLQEHSDLGAKDLNNSSSFESNSSNETVSCEFDSGQTTTHEIETPNQTQTQINYKSSNTLYEIPSTNYHPEIQNNKISNVQVLPFIKENIESNAMEISPRPIDIERIESFGSSPSAKGMDDFSDQDMISLKSEKLSLPQLSHPFKCDACDARFFIHSEYSKHRKIHEINRFQCKICKRWFSKKYLLNAHQKIHSITKPFECAICKKRYINQTNLDRHIRVYHRKQPIHTCIKCKRTFNQLSMLQIHQSVHGGARELHGFSCDTCDGKFTTENQLKLHKKIHMRKNEIEQNRRDMRSKRTFTPSIPATPKKVYKASQKPFNCNICGKQFSSVPLLRSHSQCHSAEKKYECKICKKRFSFQSTLRNHIFIHTGEKRFKCDVCHVSFRQIGHLQGHKLTHLGSKPHLCSICGKAFTLRSNLTVHMRIHTGEAPYHCSICSKKFSDSNALKRHHVMHQRKNQTQQIINEILEAPIIETSNVDQENVQVPIVQPQNNIQQASIIKAPILQMPNSQIPITETIQSISSFAGDPETILCYTPSTFPNQTKDLVFKIENEF